MIYRITLPQGIRSTTIQLPTSKSISNRLLLINVLSHSNILPNNLSDSDDTRVMLHAIQSDCTAIDVGAAGTSMRFLTAYLALVEGEHFITGSERMKRRPISILVDALRQLGAEIQYAENEGFPPLKIRGHKLRGGDIYLQGNVSSQYISAIMMIAPYVDNGLRIHLQGKIVSKPYIAMTLQIMNDYGINAIWNDDLIIIPFGQYKHQQRTVEADWSAASYWYAFAALAPQTKFKLVGLQSNSLQGDSTVVQIASNYGVNTKYQEGSVTIESQQSNNKVLDYDFNSQPDLAQTFVVLSCLMNKYFRFVGLESLVVKETDRISALVAELAKLGYKLTTNHVDTIEWHGERCEPNDEPISTYNDHRMAMAFAVATILRGTIQIRDPMVVTKSYPSFWSDIRKAGFVIEEL